MSVSRPILVALLLIAVAAIAGPVWAVFVYKPPADYRALAETSCKCARLKAGKAEKQACWHAFDQATDNAREQPGVTACFPLSEVTVDLPDGSELAIDWEVVGAAGNFCTQDEAITAEALYASIDTDDMSLSKQQLQDAMDRALAALTQLSRDYAKGKQMTLAKASGCVSGMN